MLSITARLIEEQVRGHASARAIALVLMLSVLLGGAQAEVPAAAAPAPAQAQAEAQAGQARVQAAAAPLAATAESAPGPGEARLLLRDGRSVAGRLQGIDGDQLLLGTAGGTAPVAVPLAQLVSLVQGAPAAQTASSSGPAPEPTSDILDVAAVAGDAGGDDPATARRGDRLVGRLLGGDTYGVRFQLAGAVPFNVPFDAIERLMPHASGPVDRLELLAGADADDRLWRLGRDGTPDSLTGVVQSVSSSQIVFEGALGTLEFALSDVLALVFAPDPHPAATLPGTHVVVRLRDGSRLDAGLLEWRDGRCVLATRVVERLELPTDAVAALVRRDGPVTLLADLAPTKVEQWPTYGAPGDILFPWRRDLSVSGRLLAVGGLMRASGLGVHANARLTFAVPAGAAGLLVTAGLCDEAGNLPADGSVAFEVRVNGAVVAATGLLREGDGARTLHVTGLHGGESLELLCTDGGDDDAGDRAAWVDGAFLDGAR